jgi:hypothetical protein
MSPSILFFRERPFFEALEEPKVGFYSYEYSSRFLVVK